MLVARCSFVARGFLSGVLFAFLEPALPIWLGSPSSMRGPLGTIFSVFRLVTRRGGGQRSKSSGQCPPHRDTTRIGHRFQWCPRSAGAARGRLAKEGHGMPFGITAPLLVAAATVTPR
jgi:hypothetical protein